MSNPSADQATETNLSQLTLGDWAVLPTTGWALVRDISYGHDGAILFALEVDAVGPDTMRVEWTCPPDRVDDITVAVHPTVVDIEPSSVL